MSEKSFSESGKNSDIEENKIEIKNNHWYNKNVTNLQKKFKKMSSKQSVQIVEKLTRNTEFLNIMYDRKTFLKMFGEMNYKYNKQTGKRIFTILETNLSLMILKQSHTSYNLLKYIFKLPPQKLLNKFLNKFEVRPGINMEIIGILKKLKSQLSYDTKICSLMFYETRIQPNVIYDAHLDKLIGFEDYGNGPGKEIADRILIFMIKGLKSKYKLPVSYYLCRGSTDALLLETLIIENIKQLQSAGLRVVATVCDHAQNNCEVIDLLLDGNLKYFLVNGQKIFPFYDPSTLIISVRNKLLSNDIQYCEDNTNKLAKWEHVKMLVKHELAPENQDKRLCPNLTEAHMNLRKMPKMEVECAVQTLSHSVAALMTFLTCLDLFPKECVDTAMFISIFDRVHDSLNCRTGAPSEKPLRRPLKKSSSHHKFWRKIVPTLETMKKVVNENESTKHVDILSVKKIIHNIKTMEEFFNFLLNKYYIDFLNTKNLNLDPLKNFCDNIRGNGVRNFYVTCHDFEKTLKILMLNNLPYFHSVNAKCKPDKNTPLINLRNVALRSTSQKFTSIDNEPKDITIDQENPCYSQSKIYVAKYILLKCNNINKNCPKCRNILLSKKPLNGYNDKDCTLKGKPFNYYPSQTLFECINKIYNIVISILKFSNDDKRIFINIRRICKKKIKTDVDLTFLNCENHKNVLRNLCKNNSINLIIRIWCASVNHILCGKCDKFDGTDNVKLDANILYKKKSNFSQRKQ